MSASAGSSSYQISSSMAALRVAHRFFSNSMMRA